MYLIDNIKLVFHYKCSNLLSLKIYISIQVHLINAIEIQTNFKQLKFNKRTLKSRCSIERRSISPLRNFCSDKELVIIIPD